MIHDNTTLRNVTPQQGNHPGKGHLKDSPGTVYEERALVEKFIHYLTIFTKWKSTLHIDKEES